MTDEQNKLAVIPTPPVIRKPSTEIIKLEKELERAQRWEKLTDKVFTRVTSSLPWGFFGGLAGAIGSMVLGCAIAPGVVDTALCYTCLASGVTAVGSLVVGIPVGIICEKFADGAKATRENKAAEKYHAEKRLEEQAHQLRLRDRQTALEDLQLRAGAAIDQASKAVTLAPGMEVPIILDKAEAKVAQIDKIESGEQIVGAGRIIEISTVSYTLYEGKQQANGYVVRQKHLGGNSRYVLGGDNGWRNGSDEEEKKHNAVSEFEMGAIAAIEQAGKAITLKAGMALPLVAENGEAKIAYLVSLEPTQQIAGPGKVVDTLTVTYNLAEGALQPNGYVRFTQAGAYNLKCVVGRGHLDM